MKQSIFSLSSGYELACLIYLPTQRHTKDLSNTYTLRALTQVALHTPPYSRSIESEGRDRDRERNLSIYLFCIFGLAARCRWCRSVPPQLGRPSSSWSRNRGRPRCAIYNYHPNSGRGSAFLFFFFFFFFLHRQAESAKEKGRGKENNQFPLSSFFLLLLLRSLP